MEDMQLQVLRRKWKHPFWKDLSHVYSIKEMTISLAPNFDLVLNFNSMNSDSLHWNFDLKFYTNSHPLIFSMHCREDGLVGDSICYLFYFISSSLDCITIWLKDLRACHPFLYDFKTILWSKLQTLLYITTRVTIIYWQTFTSALHHNNGSA